MKHVYMRIDNWFIVRLYFASLQKQTYPNCILRISAIEEYHPAILNDIKNAPLRQRGAKRGWSPLWFEFNREYDRRQGTLFMGRYLDKGETEQESVMYIQIVKKHLNECQNRFVFNL